MTQAFCRDCTRARLSTEGKLYTCLFADQGHDLRALLRGGADDAELARARSPPSGARRDDRYSEIRTAETATRAQGRDVATSAADPDERHRAMTRPRVIEPPMRPAPPGLTHAARPATFDVEAHQRARRGRA